MKKVLIVATSRKTRGGITSVIKAHETGEQWKQYHCHWVETHRDGPKWRKIVYFIFGTLEFLLLAPWYDIIHMHVSFQGSLNRKCMYMRIAKFLHKKTIVHFHPPTPDVLNVPENQPKYRYLFGNANKVLVLSEIWIKWLDETIGIRGNVQRLYNPCPVVPANEIFPTSVREKYILFAGTLIVRKGYKSLIKAFSHIAEKYPDWKVLLAGVDEEHAAGAFIQECKVEKQVELLGWCDKQKMKALYQQASIYCLASSGEGFPMVVLEAWAYGTPVVCTPVGGLPDIIEEGTNALSFPFDDDTTLAKQLDLLISNENLRKKLSDEGLKLSRDVFNIQVINRQLGEIYQEL